MAALTQDRKSDPLGTQDQVYPVLLRYPVEASTSIYGGALVGINAAGNAVPASAIGSLKLIGRAERQILNLATGGTTGPDGIANGNAGSISVPVKQGVFYFNINADSTIDKTKFGQNVFASDDNTVSLSDAGGTRPFAGWVVDYPSNMTTSTTQVGVFVGVANPFALNPELQNTATQYKARAVVTSLQAYTGSGTGTLTETVNGAWAAQDGITNVVNDIVFIPEGTANLTAAKDAGPWQISSLGAAGAKWVLIRPDWWQNGAAIVQGIFIVIGGEGTVWAGNSFTSFVATGKLVGTDAPLFWPERSQATGTLANGSLALTSLFIGSGMPTGFPKFFPMFNGAPVNPGFLRVSASAAGSGSGTATITSTSGTDASPVSLTIINY